MWIHTRIVPCFVACPLVQKYHRSDPGPCKDTTACIAVLSRLPYTVTITRKKILINVENHQESTVSIPSLFCTTAHVCHEKEIKSLHIQKSHYPCSKLASWISEPVLYISQSLNNGLHRNILQSKGGGVEDVNKHYG